jgi:restriction system protein
MPIPDFQTLMLPMLKAAEDGKEHSMRDLREALAGQFKLTDSDRAALLPSGRQPIFDNRVGWAVTYLRKGKLLEATGRAKVRISDRGRQAIKECKGRVDLKYLSRFSEIQQFRGEPAPAADEQKSGAAAPALEQMTPEELLTRSYRALRGALADELVDRLYGASDKFFEHKVVELLVGMGYGGSFEDAAEVVGGPGDEGIDGVIKEDKLGLDVVYVQAKKWARDRRIGRPELQKFAGSLLGKRARKGVFITTASFAKEAEEYVKGLEQKIVLIDGARLAELMIDHDIGVSVKEVFKLKRLDEDFFDET